MLQINKGVKLNSKSEQKTLKAPSSFKAFLPFIIVISLSRLAIYIYFVFKTVYCIDYIEEDRFARQFNNVPLTHGESEICLLHDIRVYDWVLDEIGKKISSLKWAKTELLRNTERFDINQVNHYLPKIQKGREYYDRRFRYADRKQKLIIEKYIDEYFFNK